MRTLGRPQNSAMRWIPVSSVVRLSASAHWRCDVS